MGNLSLVWKIEYFLRGRNNISGHLQSTHYESTPILRTLHIYIKSHFQRPSFSSPLFFVFWLKLLFSIVYSFCTAKEYYTVWTYHCLFTCSRVQGHLACFQFGVIMIRTVINIHVLCEHVFISSWKIPKRVALLAHTISAYFIFFIFWKTDSQEVAKMVQEGLTDPLLRMPPTFF